MSYTQSRDNRTVIAGADLRLHQFAMVKFDGNAKAVLCGNGDAALGVLLVPANTGNAATVTVSGQVMAEVGTGGVTLGASVACNADGHLVAAAANDVIVGTALEAGAVGVLIAVELSLANNVAS